MLQGSSYVSSQGESRSDLPQLPIHFSDNSPVASSLVSLAKDSPGPSLGSMGKETPAPSLDIPDKESPALISPGTPEASVKTMASRIRESTQLRELGEPSQHVSGAPFVLIPDENLEAAKVEFKDFIYARFHGDAPEMGRVIGVVNAI